MPNDNTLLPPPQSRNEALLTGILNAVSMPSGEEIAEAVGDWLNAHVSPETGYVIDNSLTVEGAAADAKAVGDALTDFSNDYVKYVAQTLTDAQQEQARENIGAGSEADVSELRNTVNMLPEIKDSDVEDVDLDISDPEGNVVARFVGGSIVTKDFDSSKVGNLDNLTTTEKSTLVGAINEIDSNLSADMPYYEGASGTLIQLNGLTAAPAHMLELTLPYKSGGYSGADVFVSGKNLLDFANATVNKGSASTTFNKTSTTLSVTNGTAYIDLLTITSDDVNKHFTLSATVSSGDGAYSVCYHEKDSTNMVGSYPTLHIGASFVGYVLCIVFYKGTSGTEFTNIQVEITPSTTATAYEMHSGTKYTATLPNGFYGGTIDIVSGTGKNIYASDGTETTATDITFAACNVMMLSGHNCVYSDYDMKLFYFVPIAEAFKQSEQPKPIRITLFDRTKPVNRYSYCGFSGGCVLGGKEIYVSRYGVQHLTPASHVLYGKLGFIAREQNGAIANVVFPDLGYSSLNCELRDPNLSNINQNKAFLSGFATNNDESTPVYSNYLYVINSDLSVADSLVFETDKLFWGNTLITPDGYLLHCAYDTSSTLYLMRSTSVYSSAVNEIEFTVAQTLDNAANESTIFYWNDKLVVVARTTDAVRDCALFESSNQEGTGTFTKHTLGLRLHSPAANLTNSGSHLLFAAGLVDGTARQPCILMLDSSFAVVSYAPIDTTIEDYGGYPTFVRLGRECYGMAYYDEPDGGGTNLYLKDVNINYYLNTAYHPF